MHVRGYHRDPIQEFWSRYPVDYLPQTQAFEDRAKAGQANMFFFLETEASQVFQMLLSRQLRWDIRPLLLLLPLSLIHQQDNDDTSDVYRILPNRHPCGAPEPHAWSIQDYAFYPIPILQYGNPRLVGVKHPIALQNQFYPAVFEVYQNRRAPTPVHLQLNLLAWLTPERSL